MTYLNSQSRRSESGFTLVELAIVMIIIGLLIGGILKGQELINNSRVSSSVTQIKGVEAAISTFRDKYSSLPGDMLVPGAGNTPANRLPNCAAGTVCATNGDGDSLVEWVGNDAGAVAVNSEAGRMFIHLAAAGMMSGNVNPGLAVWAAAGAFPALNLGGDIRLGYNNNVAPTGIIVAGNQSAHFMAIGVGAGVAMNAGTLAASAAANIDRKLDDGAPNTGSVLAAGTAGAAVANCASANGAAGLYNEQLDGRSCGLFIRAIN